MFILSILCWMYEVILLLLALLTAAIVGLRIPLLNGEMVLIAVVYKSLTGC